ncbi:hypothetical protein [Bacillus sp. Marseille-P3661]|uniref:hypothetical protein n=1 Tax=Bacillus sp. Marseille-P3661 TaxID=1936234 RepID=UPI000C8258C0|nr:hypothetical protein [Bacillus sp. Marseille-P3661]
MGEFFIENKRLGILVPELDREWDQYNKEVQQEILLQWEIIRGHIPDRIKELEQTINKKQAQLDEEEVFEISCQLNSEIAELASVINDLWLYYRINQDLSEKVHQ